MVQGFLTESSLNHPKRFAFLKDENVTVLVFLAHKSIIHTGRATRRARKFERKSFDVACVQCEHFHP